MPLIKRHKRSEKLQTERPSSSQKLFVDYPYPLLAELERQCEKREKLSTSSYTLEYLRRYKDYLNRMLSSFNNLHNHGSSRLMLEKSAIEGSSFKFQVKSLPERRELMNKTQFPARSINLMVNDSGEQSNEQNVLEQHMISPDDRIANNQG